MNNDVTFEHIRQSNRIEGVDDPAEIERSDVAWNYLKIQDDLNFEAILAVHYMIMYRLLPREAGKLRKHNVTVGGRLCPSHYEVEGLLDNWIDAVEITLRFGGTETPVEEQAKKFHIEFEHIHPFADGNGRTGRMLMWWHQIKLGQPPTLIKYNERRKYYEWF